MTNSKTTIAIGLAIGCIVTAIYIAYSVKTPFIYSFLFLGYLLVYLLLLLAKCQDAYMKKKRKRQQVKSIKRTVLHCEVQTETGNLILLKVTNVDFAKALTTVYAVCKAHHYNLRSVTVVDNH